MALSRRYTIIPQTANGNADVVIGRRTGNSLACNVVITASSGTISVQPQGSLDGINFENIGSALTATTRNIALDAENHGYRVIRFASNFTTGSGVGTVNATVFAK